MPGLARKIIDRAELEMAHRHDVEKLQLQARIRDRQSERAERERAQWLAFFLVLGLMTCGTVLAMRGQSKVSMVIFGTTIAAVVGAYIVGRVLSKSDPKSAETAPTDPGDQSD